MKIRTGFVTNSSSYSSAEIRIDNPVLLEILKQYKKNNAFGTSEYNFGKGIGKRAKGKELAWKFEDEEMAEIFFAPENLNDVLHRFIDVMDERVDLDDDIDKAQYEALKQELKQRRREINAAYVDVSWHARNDSYGESEPEEGEETEWEYSYSSNVGEAASPYDGRDVDWLNDQDNLLDDVKVFDINGKTFVFSGVVPHNMEPGYDDEYSGIVNKIEENGGFCRSKVSSKTDYLIVNPSDAGFTKTVAALEQKRRGSQIKIALWDDLVSYLNGPFQLSRSQNVDLHDKQKTFSDDAKDNEDKHNPMTLLKKADDVNAERANNNNATPIVNNKDDENSSETNNSAIDRKDYEYIIIENGGVQIQKYKGIRKKVAIPAVVENLSVTAIGPYAFDSNTEITSVELPSSIITICNGSFHRCMKLTDVNFPDKLETIERSAFSGCTSLTSVVLPNSLKVLQGEVFTGCSKLTSITLPSKLDTVFKNSFPGNKALVLIVPPNSPMEQWVKEKGFQYTHVGQGNNNSGSFLEQRNQKYKEIEKRVAELKIEVHEFAEKVRADTERMNKNIEDSKRLQAEISELTNEYNGITGWFKGRQRKELLERIEVKKAELNRLEEERFN